MTHEVPPVRSPAPGYLWRVLLALDRLVNAITGGDDRATLSERWRDCDSWLCWALLRHFAHDDHERRPRG